MSDSMIVASDFGLYAADHVQKIQLVLLAKCSDETATGLVCRRFTDWLAQSGEGRATLHAHFSRKRICKRSPWGRARCRYPPRTARKGQPRR